jgi:hypothetical protein
MLKKKKKKKKKKKSPRSIILPKGAEDSEGVNPLDKTIWLSMGQMKILYFPTLFVLLVTVDGVIPGWGIG